VPGGINQALDSDRVEVNGFCADPDPFLAPPLSRLQRDRLLFALAQKLLRQGHSYLDGNGDGEACESLRP